MAIGRIPFSQKEESISLKGLSLFYTDLAQYTQGKLGTHWWIDIYTRDPQLTQGCMQQFAFISASSKEGVQ